MCETGAKEASGLSGAGTAKYDRVSVRAPGWNTNVNISHSTVDFFVVQKFYH